MFYTMYLDGEYHLLLSLHLCDVSLEHRLKVDGARLPRVTAVACRCHSHMANLQLIMEALHSEPEATPHVEVLQSIP